MKFTAKVAALVIVGSFIGWWACPVRGFASTQTEAPYVTVTRHGEAVATNLPRCVREDGGNLPCHRFDGTKPWSYWIGGRGVIHYVWWDNPLRMFPGWHYRTTSPDAKCIKNPNGGEVLCPWGELR